MAASLKEDKLERRDFKRNSFKDRERRDKKDSKHDMKPRRRGFSPMRGMVKVQLAKENINYKNFNLLQKFISDRGKVLSRRSSGISAKEQRRINESIKQARFLGLLPTGRTKR